MQQRNRLIKTAQLVHSHCACNTLFILYSDVFLRTSSLRLRSYWFYCIYINRLFFLQGLQGIFHLLWLDNIYRKAMPFFSFRKRRLSQIRSIVRRFG